MSAAHQIGFKGILRPIHPTAKIIAGIQSLPSLEEFPGHIDAAFIGVNRYATLDIVAQLHSLGAGESLAQGALATAPPPAGRPIR